MLVDGSLSGHPRPRVVLLTRDSAYSRLFARSFLACNAVDVVGIVFSTSYLRRGQDNSIKDLVQFISRVGLCYALYQAYVTWFLPIALGLHRSIWKAFKAPALQSTDINSPASTAWLRRMEPDFVLSFHFNQKIVESTAAIPTMGAINFHPSLLPHWRGVDPVYFTLESGASSFGVSLHLLAPEIDGGDVLFDKSYPEMSGGLIQINTQLFKQGGEMAAKLLANYPAYLQARTPQPLLVDKKDRSDQYAGWHEIGRAGCKTLWKIL